MSAHERPVCGRAIGRFSTLTASAGRLGTAGLARRPESGQIGGVAGVVGLLLGDPFEPFANGGLLEEPKATSPTTPPPTRTTATISAERTRPRLLKAIRCFPPCVGRSVGSRCYPAPSARTTT